MLTFEGNFDNTERFLKKAKAFDLSAMLDGYGRKGVAALANAIPKDTGLAASSWGYTVIRSKTNPGIEWYNTNKENGVLVVILIQYGHATRGGGYVSGRDFINPVIRPIFDQIVADIWKELKA